MDRTLPGFARACRYIDLQHFLIVLTEFGLKQNEQYHSSPPFGQLAFTPHICISEKLQRVPRFPARSDKRCMNWFWLARTHFGSTEQHILSHICASSWSREEGSL